MLIKKASDIRSSEITPRDLYMNRREFMLAASAAGLSAAALSGLDAFPSLSSANAAEKFPNPSKSFFSTDEKLNSLKDITTYNNFYELGTDKGDRRRTPST